MEEFNFQQPNQSSPAQQISDQQKKPSGRKFMMTILIVAVVGGLAYAYSTYLAWESYNEVARQAEEAQRSAR